MHPSDVQRQQGPVRRGAAMTPLGKPVAGRLKDELQGCRRPRDASLHEPGMCVRSQEVYVKGQLGQVR